MKERRDDTQDPFDPSEFEIPWNLNRVGVDRAWSEHGVTGRGVVVAVLDSGMMAIPALTQSLWHNSMESLNGKDDDGNGYVDDVFGYDFRKNSPYNVTPSRPAHGTLCAGIIAGRPSAQPKAIVTGIAPRSKIMPLCGSGQLSIYEYALEQGADVLSMSYTMDPQNLGHYRGMFRTAHEHLAAAGVVSVGGAGNYARSRPEGWQIGTPQRYSMRDRSGRHFLRTVQSLRPAVVVRFPGAASASTIPDPNGPQPVQARRDRLLRWIPDVDSSLSLGRSKEGPIAGGSRGWARLRFSAGTAR